MKDTFIQLGILSSKEIAKDVQSLTGPILPMNVNFYGRKFIYYQLKEINKKMHMVKLVISVDAPTTKMNNLNKIVSRLEFDYVIGNKNKKVTDSLIKVLNKFNTDVPGIIEMGDTLINSKHIYSALSKYKDKNIIFVSRNWLLNRWEIYAKDTFYDLRDKNLNFDGQDLGVLTGVLIFTPETIKKVKKVLTTKFYDYNISLSTFLKLLRLKYNISFNIYEIPPEDWIDIGHIDRYFEARRKLIQYTAREFNDIKVNGYSVEKRSSSEKILWEIQWYLNVPTTLKPYTPSLYKYDLISKKYILEYVPYPSLTELLLSGYGSFNEWSDILFNLFDISSKFRNYKGNVSKEDYKEMYINKMNSRFKELPKELVDILQKNSNFDKLRDIIGYLNNHKKEIVEWLYDENDNSFIHGDFCFSNILFSPFYRIYKLIDPRGKFGMNHNGDIKYDLAKLRHSLDGYDHILCGYFDVSDKDIKISYRKNLIIKLKNLFDDYIIKKYNRDYLLKVKFIESTLFLSMLPLHKDDPSRVAHLAIKGLKIWGEIKNEIQSTVE